MQFHFSYSLEDLAVGHPSPADRLSAQEQKEVTAVLLALSSSLSLPHTVLFTSAVMFAV